MKEITHFIDRAHKKLSVSFPTLTEKARKVIINTYIGVVTSEIKGKQKLFRREDLHYSISLDDIRQKTRKTIAKQSYNMGTWFLNTCPLFQIITKGSNLNGFYTEIKMNYNISTAIDIAYSIIVKGGEVDLIETIEDLYGTSLAPILINAIENNDLTPFDIVSIDIKSLKAFIDTHEEYIKNNKDQYEQGNDKLRAKIRDAKRIYCLASVCGGKLYQIISKSDFGRTFYRGPNLQSIRKEVRCAALGKCFEYDINNSVYAWRLNEVRKIVKENGGGLLFSSTVKYMESKKHIRKSLSKCIQNAKLTNEFKEKLIKQAFTAMGFGARGTKKAIFWGDKKNKTYALNSIIMNKEDRERFLEDSFVVAFINEQDIISKIIFEYHKSSFITNEAVCNEKGVPLISKVLSMLYQTAETDAMNYALSHIAEEDIMLRCHDAFYISPSSDMRRESDISDVRFKLNYLNPELTLEKTEVKAWTYIDNTEYFNFINQHNEMMRKEEAKAKGYTSELLDKNIYPKIKTFEELLAEKVLTEEQGLEEEIQRQERICNSANIIEDLLKRRVK